MRQHDPDYFSLAAGLLFTILGIVFAISAATTWIVDGRWVAPAILIALGAGGVAASLAASSRQSSQSEALTSGETGAPRDPYDSSGTAL